MPGKGNPPAATEQTPRSLLLDTDVAQAPGGGGEGGGQSRCGAWELGLVAPVIDRRAAWEGVSCREEAGRQLRKPYPSIWRSKETSQGLMSGIEPRPPPPPGKRETPARP